VPELWGGKSQACGLLDLAMWALWSEVCWRGVFTISAGRGAEEGDAGRGGGWLDVEVQQLRKANRETP